jgi:hypothetical protein
MKRTSSLADRKHLAKVQALGCILCSHVYGNHDTPAEVHHVRAKHGWGRSSHLMTIPLCPEHHRGNTGVHNHGRDEFAQIHGSSEMLLLAVVQEQLGVLL